jgi:hypothetical protein
MSVRVDAAIFADGLAVGDTEAIKYVCDLWQGIVTGYQEIFHRIEVDVPDIGNREDAVGILTQIQDERFTPATPLAERMGVGQAYATVIGNLRDSTGPTAPVLEGLHREAEAMIKAIHEQKVPAQVSQ